MSDVQRLYAMRDTETQHIKVGISRHPQVRAWQLSLKLKREVALLFDKEVKNASIAEQFVHQQLKDFNIKGEWFNLQPYQEDALPTLFDSARDLDHLPTDRPARSLKVELNWKLKTYLSQHGKSAYQLARAMDGKPRTNEAVLYRIEDGKPIRVNVESLERILTGIQALGLHDVTLPDIVDQIR